MPATGHEQSLVSGNREAHGAATLAEATFGRYVPLDYTTSPNMNNITSRCLLLNLASVLIMAAGLGNAAAQTEVYRWKDSNGRVHFGDRPDAGDSRDARRVVVPAPNLADGVKVRPPAGNAAVAPPVITPNPPTRPAMASTGPRGVAAQQQDSCKAQWAAYNDSAACYGGCGGTRQGGTRNNAACSHCADTPMPSCSEPLYFD